LNEEGRPRELVTIIVVLVSTSSFIVLRSTKQK
jgi:hypothetical protein